MKESEIDYSSRGCSIQEAMLDHVRRWPSMQARPQTIRWGDRRIATGHTVEVPLAGVVVGEILGGHSDLAQGFDLKFRGGGVHLRDGRIVETLRTWADPDLPSTIEYPFTAPQGVLVVWNVYRLTYPGGPVAEEMWTGNAGLWWEEHSPLDFTYHCSHALCRPPDFTAFRFRLTMRPS